MAGFGPGLPSIWEHYWEGAEREYPQDDLQQPIATQYGAGAILAFDALGKYATHPQQSTPMVSRHICFTEIFPGACGNRRKRALLQNVIVLAAREGLR